MRIADQPVRDGGSNFGRVARVSGLMDNFIRIANNTEVLGIRIGDWHSFLRQHADQANLDEVSARLKSELSRRIAGTSEADAQLLVAAVLAMAEVLDRAE